MVLDFLAINMFTLFFLPLFLSFYKLLFWSNQACSFIIVVCSHSSLFQ